MIPIVATLRGTARYRHGRESSPDAGSVLDLDANALRLPERQSALASRAVKKALQNREDLRGFNVAVKNCVARLTGTVPTGMQRLDAAVVARSTPGVCSVQDDLRVAD